MSQAQERRALRVVQQPPAKRLHLLVVNSDPGATSLLREGFADVTAAALEITPSAKAAMRALSVEPYDLVALDPETTSGGFALLKHIKDHYRWTATLAATNNQEPRFLSELVKCRIDGLLFRQTMSEEFVEEALLLARDVSDRRRREQKRVLAIGAHPDDVEIGCGGALAKHHEDYDALHILTLSRGAAGGDTNLRMVEAHNAAALVGAELEIGNLRDTDISPGAETITLIEAAIAKLHPTHIYTHASADTHQDHRAIHAASLVAARSVPNVYCYQSPSSTMEFNPHHFVDITHHIDKKIDLIGAYKSQVERMEAMQPDVVLATARYWGRFAGYVLAEPMQIIRQRDFRAAPNRNREQARRHAASLADKVG